MEIIFISIGDINGIGQELILKTIRGFDPSNIYIIVGNRRIFDETATVLGSVAEDISDTSEQEIVNLRDPGIYFLDIDIEGIRLNFGIPDSKAGLLAGTAIKKAVELAELHNGAVVTAPINKYSLHMGGFFYPGHTEFIAEILNSKEYLMILDGGIIKVALVTTHLAIKDVAKSMNGNLIYEKGSILYRSLVRDYGISEPRITVCSLNPHASDGGLFGTEEKDIIIPAVEKLNAEIADGKGHFTIPLPADTAFTRSYLDKTDAYLVMYHDQGLIPLKLLSFGNAVNFTAGLPVVRTSPDHGTAYDIAGKGIAESVSFENAVKKALFFLNNRKF
ncbi:MAG: 4-hydroxythreonine-4-phosphate dehydrogenase PdxA [Candidatus Delongbacteria bacterium]|nr:4-hydroxythreonine-4-phosphate dehydrogenase PdxA [Candidatus Delongbacteria bacterium]